MKFSLDLKQCLQKQLIAILEAKVSEMQRQMHETSESMKNDTKSSAGDKFETGREMLQLELNNKHKQFDQLMQLQKDALKIDVSKAHDKIAFGSLVQVKTGIYFISIALGSVELEGQKYYAMSLASPIGKALHNHQKGDAIQFNGKVIEVLDVV